MNLPPHAEELRTLLEQTLFIIGRLVGDLQALQTELTQLEIDLLCKQFFKHCNPTQLEDELGGLRKKLTTQMEELVPRVREVERTIQAKTVEQGRINEELQALPGLKEYCPGIRSKSVLQFDMVGYGIVANRFENNFGIESVGSLDKEISRFGVEALRAIGVLHRSVFVSSGGDSVTYAFEQPPDAFAFSEHFYRGVGKHNACIKDPALFPLCRRYFRMGASTGRISWKPIGGGLFDAGGTRIIDAVRFQDAGYPGELFVDESTFKGLLPEQQARFETQSLEVKGKREESYTIRRCVFDNQAAMEAEKYGLWKRKTGSRRGWKIAIKDLLRYLKR